MTQPIDLKVKRRILITKAQRRRLENAKRRLLEAQQAILWNNPNAASEIFPHQVEVKTCRELVEDYLRLTSGHLKPKTVLEKHANLKVFTDWLGPRQLDREAVEMFNVDLHKIEWADSTKHLVGVAVASFLTWLYDSKRVKEDFRRGIKFPSQPRQKPRPIYSAEEVQKLVDAADDRPIGFIILLAYNTGMAISDCCNLTWGSIDMDKLTITRNRQKTDVEAIITVKFGSALHRALERQREDTIRAFNSCDPGLPVCRWAYQNKHGFYTLFRRLCAQCAIPYRSFHSFRATMATSLMNTGTPLNVALKVMGLRSVQQMVGYATTPAESIREHMERLRT